MLGILNNWQNYDENSLQSLLFDLTKTYRAAIFKNKYDLILLLIVTVIDSGRFQEVIYFLF